jgi:hypothetical protein
LNVFYNVFGHCLKKLGLKTYFFAVIEMKSYKTKHNFVKIIIARIVTVTDNIIQIIKLTAITLFDVNGIRLIIFHCHVNDVAV